MTIGLNYERHGDIDKELQWSPGGRKVAGLDLQEKGEKELEM